MGRTPSPSALPRMILGTFDSTILHRLLTDPVLGPKTTLLKGIHAASSQATDLTALRHVSILFL